MKVLHLKDGIRTTVYMLIVHALKSHPALKACIHPNGWRTYTGEPDIETPAGEDTLPAIEVLPFAMAAGPASIVTQESPMGIGISIACEGLDVRDLLNLWEAVEGALFKGDGQAKLLHKLKAAVAELSKPQGDYPTAGVAAIGLTNPGITVTEAQLSKQIMVASGTITIMGRIPR